MDAAAAELRAHTVILKEYLLLFLMRENADYDFFLRFLNSFRNNAHPGSEAFDDYRPPAFEHDFNDALVIKIFENRFQLCFK